MSKPDLQFSNAGSFATCEARTVIGARWVARKLANATCDEGLYVIEFRYLEDIVTGARADGLICEG